MAAGSSTSIKSSDKNSKIQEIEEKLKHLNNSPNDLVINNQSKKDDIATIKRFQYNKDAPNGHVNNEKHRNKHTKTYNHKRKPY